MDGVIVIDKPEGWTSHDVVARSRRILKTKKIGHLGTLDPIATGVLPLVIGRATRLAQFYTRSDKVYEGVVRFGWSTDSYDRAGAPTSDRTEPCIDASALEAEVERFRGEFRQAPPPVSAKKVNGQRAYELAVLGIDGPSVRLRAHCSGGTYIRSIAHELGQAMGCGAHIEQLRRLSSGEFGIEQARTIAQLEALAADGRLVDALVPAGQLLPGFPSVYVDDSVTAQIRHGRNFPASPFRSPAASRYVKAVTRHGELVAIGECVLPNLYHPGVVL